MSLWFLIAAAFVVQEFATTAITLVLAERSALPFWPIHIIWLVTTAIDMYVGYTFGSLLKKKLANNDFIKKIEAWVGKMSGALGKHGTALFLMFLGVINFPYLNTFIASWIGVPMNTAFLYTLIGNFFWYLLLWGTVLGLTSFIHNPSIILLIIVVIGIASHLAFRYSERPRKKKG